MLEWAMLGTAVLAQAVGVVVWGIRQEGRIHLQEQRVTDLKELINTRFDMTEQRLERIEKCLNGMLRHE